MAKAYTRWPERTEAQRFFEKVNKEGPFPDPVKYPDLQDRCWVWMAGKQNFGYGAFRTKDSLGRNIFEGSHRWVWKYENGEIPEGKRVLHKCDNPSCCNPSHLFTGTQKDNRIDCVRKMRHDYGESHKLSKLNEMQVRVMRRMREFGIPYSYMGQVFGVAFQTAWRAVNFKNWAHV